MKERPILFNGVMVRAILEGRKTQTRRPVKDIDLFGCFTGDCPHWQGTDCAEGVAHFAREHSPFGQPGDRLWVRETFAINHIMAGWDPIPKEALSFDDGGELTYRADGDWKDQYEQIEGDPPPWRPSIHMPRWASRINLEITGVRVERLRSISKEDAMAEGIMRGVHGYFWGGDTKDDPRHVLGSAQTAFGNLWIKTGGDWNANPWVWVIEFKRVQS